MFNQNSTSSERRAFLMALLDTENDDEEVLTLFVYKASGQTAHTAEADPGFYSIK